MVYRISVDGEDQFITNGFYTRCRQLIALRANGADEIQLRASLSGQYDD